MEGADFPACTIRHPSSCPPGARPIERKHRSLRRPFSGSRAWVKCSESEFQSPKGTERANQSRFIPDEVLGSFFSGSDRQAPLAEE
jgi:hypothetical protein